MTASTEAHAEDHNRIVAEQHNALVRAQDRVDAALHDVHRAAGDRTGRRHGNRHATWMLSTREATERARRIAAGNRPADLPDVVAVRKITASRAGQAIQALAIAEEQRDAEQAKLGELESVRRWIGHWPLFLLVAGGHRHAGRSCHSLRATTRTGIDARPP